MGSEMCIRDSSFPEAVEALATLAGMEMPKADPQAEARAARNKETVSWMERAQGARPEQLIEAGLLVGPSESNMIVMSALV